MIKTYPTRLFARYLNRFTSAHIFHITDSEGSQSFFENIKNSHIVNYHPERGIFFRNVKSGSYFIYGGDATDKGNYDLAITKALVEFKERHPHYVFLLAGNREITKNRIKIELDENVIRQRLLNTEHPRWISKKNFTTPLDYVLADMNIHGKTTISEDKQAIQKYVNSLTIKQCQLIYLHWMLEKTMGCPHTFRYRQEELKRQTHKAIITDEEVLESFIKESLPNGLSGRYLRLAQVGAIIPNTGVMAIHGGLQSNNIGRIPGSLQYYSNIYHWLHNLNQWYHNQINQWIHFKPTRLTKPACTQLDDSVLPLPNTAKSVIIANMLNEKREFIPVSEPVISYLKNNNISLVLTGHQPSGDHPSILRAQNILFVNGDTGYANFDPNNPDDTRGKARHTLEIINRDNQMDLMIRATLPSSEKVTTAFRITPQKILGDSYIGKILPDGYLVQCRLSNGDYRLIQQKGYQVNYLIIPLGELEKRLTQESFIKCKL